MSKQSLQYVRFVAFSFVLALLVFLPSAAPAQSPGADCSQLVVNRSYSQTFEGFLNVPAYFASFGIPAPPGIGIVPNAGSGVLTFLPQGKLKGRVTLAIGLLGLIPNIEPDDTSTYSLLWDTSKDPVVCSGALTINAPGEVFHFQLLVIKGGQQIETIHTDTGLIVSVTGMPMETAGCNNNSLSGKYTYNAKAWGLSAPDGPLSFPPDQTVAGYFPFGFSGAIEFNPGIVPSLAEYPGLPEGSAYLRGWDTVSLNGQIVPRTYEGWYKVNADCSAPAVLRDSLHNPDIHVEMFIGKGRQSAHLVNVDTVPNTTIPAFLLSMTMTRVGAGH